MSKNALITAEIWITETGGAQPFKMFKGEKRERGREARLKEKKRRRASRRVRGKRPKGKSPQKDVRPAIIGGALRRRYPLGGI